MPRIASVLVGCVVVAAAAGFALWMANDAGHAAADAAVCAEVERLLQAGETGAARRAIEHAKTRVAPHVYQYLLAADLLAQGRLDAAKEPAEAAYAGAPAARDDWRIVSAIVTVRIAARDPAGAWIALDAFVKAHPEDERGLATAAQFLIRVKEPPDPGAALSMLEAIDRLPRRAVPDSDPTAISAERLAALRSETAFAGQLASTISSALDHVKVAPRDPMAHAALSDAYLMSDRKFEAAGACRKALELDPSNELFRRQLATLLLEQDVQGDPAEIDRLTEAILAAAPDDPQAQILRARAHVRADRYVEAKAGYEAILARQDLPREVRRDICRNLAALIYDWNAGGTQPEYLAEARAYLRQYRELGGEIDGRLQDMSDKLDALAKPPGDSGGTRK